MTLDLTPAQVAAAERFRDTARETLAPCADRVDRDEQFPRALIEAMASLGYLGAVVPAELGGAAMDMVTFGLLNHEIGRWCASARSLLTVHTMVLHALLRWGSPALRARWVPPLSRGELIGAFALSEPGAGSDAQSLATEAIPTKDGYVLRGKKSWISFGQMADLLLVFAKAGGQPTAFLLETNSPGIAIKPTTGLLGARGSMVATIELDGCFVPAAQRVGGVGMGCALVAASALEYGRYSVAWGCVGAGQACLDASLRYAGERVQFGQRLQELQLIRRMLSDMVTNVKAARLLCLHAGQLKDRGDAQWSAEVSIAKYFASTALSRIASDAVQIHGANGCSSAFPVQRYMRDAKVMEIIEGSTQLHQVSIAGFALDVMAP